MQTLDVVIRAAAQGYTLEIAGTSIGETAPQPFMLPFELAQLPQERSRAASWIKQARVALRRGGSEEQRLAREFGSALFTRLYSGEALAAYRLALARLDPDERLLLRLRLPSALAVLPWELLYDPGEQSFLALDPRLALVRYLELPQPLTPLPIDGPLRVVAVLASPNSRLYTPLRLDRELTRMHAALQPLEAQGRVQLDVIRGPRTLGQLRARMREPVHVLHIISHGDIAPASQEGVLVWEDAAGQAETVSAALLREHLRAQRGQTRLVLLNACLGALPPINDDPFSSLGAALIQAGVPAVIAMQFEVPDDVGADLAEVFYDEIAAAQPVDRALSQARLHLYGKYQHSLDWAVPVLFLRAPNGLLFAPQHAQAEQDALTLQERSLEMQSKLTQPTSNMRNSVVPEQQLQKDILYGPTSVEVDAFRFVFIKNISAKNFVLSKDDKLLVCNAVNRHNEGIYFFDANTGEEIGVFNYDTRKKVTRLALSDNEELLAASFNDKSVIILKSGASPVIVASIKMDDDCIAVIFSENSETLIICLSNGRLIFWDFTKDTPTGNVLRTRNINSIGKIFNSSNNRYIAFETESGVVTFFDLQKNAFLKSFKIASPPFHLHSVNFGRENTSIHFKKRKFWFSLPNISKVEIQLPGIPQSKSVDDPDPKFASRHPPEFSIEDTDLKVRTYVATRVSYAGTGNRIEIPDYRLAVEKKTTNEIILLKELGDDSEIDRRGFYGPLLLLSSTNKQTIFYIRGQHISIWKVRKI